MSLIIESSLKEALPQLSWKNLLKSKRVYLKINMVSASALLSMTPKDTIEETIRFLREKLNYSGEIIIIEGSATGGSTQDGFRRLGVSDLSKKYDLELMDIHDDEMYEVTLFNSRFEELRIPISKTLVDAPFIISLCRAKTHDTVVVTLSIKNIAVGGIVGKGNRPRIHQGYKAININIAILGAIMMPDISIIDGRTGMEGDGPVHGTPKEWGYVFIGNNPVETDAVVAYGMGFRPQDVGYLYYLDKLGFGNIENIEKRFPKIAEIRTQFKPHTSYEEQLNWKVESDFEKELLEKAKKIIEKYPRGRKI